MTPSLTIIIPVRNGGSYLPLAIGSVLCQTERNWKLIILENCSTDGTPAYLASLDDPRIETIPAPEPLNIEESWARIASLDVAGLTTILGHDDILHPDFVTGALADAAAHPDTSLWMSHFNLINADGHFLRNCAPMPEHDSGTGFLHDRWHHRRDSYGTGYVFQFKDYVDCGGIPSFPGLLYADDYIWFSIASKRSIYCSPAVRFSYRSHDSSAARRSDSAKAIDAAFHLISKLSEDSASDDSLRKFLSDNGRRFAEHCELCYWQAIVHQGRELPRARAGLLEAWALRRNTFPLRANCLKFAALRLFWRFRFAMK